MSLSSIVSFDSRLSILDRRAKDNRIEGAVSRIQKRKCGSANNLLMPNSKKGELMLPFSLDSE